SELVANAWDANATKVEITIPEIPIIDASEIVVQDNGIGMSDMNIRKAYLIIGRDRRKGDGTDCTPLPFERPVMGRKGIGKFSAFGIAKEIEVETIREGEFSRLRMNYDALIEQQDNRKIRFPPLLPSGNVEKGTRITLRNLIKYRTRRIPILQLRRGLARRFSIIGESYNFAVIINGVPIMPTERNFQQLLEIDREGNRYIWEYEQHEIAPDSGWTISGWIGALDRTSSLADGIQRGIAILARGKLVQEPFVFDATVGQQFALSYLIGELHAEFVDAEEDSIGTTRNSLVWDTEANIALKDWGQREVNKIAREWAAKRQADNEAALEENPLYIKFKARADEIGNRRATKIADKFVRSVVKRNVIGDVKDQESIIQSSLDWLEFDAFQEIAEDLADTNVHDIEQLLALFREWEVVEAKEMAKVSNGRVSTIQKLQDLIDQNALEVPELHNFLKEFPWTIDPRWTLIDDEVTYSQLLREQFPDASLEAKNRRIDFLCVGEAEHLVVVEIKRPHSKVSKKELDQIEEYVSFMRDHIQKLTDPSLKYRKVTGYLLCGDMVDTYQVREKRKNLETAGIYIKLYKDLLRMVKSIHKQFLDKYDALQKAKRRMV
ncbi:Heat shock protein G homolog, partial [hydrothermal vent metagenome]